MNLDPELRWFLMAMIAMFIIGLPLIKKNISLPVELKFLEVPRERLTPRQAEFFDATDRKLGELGFHPLNTFRVVNLGGRNISRTYTSSSDPARILVSSITAPKGNVTHTYFEISSKYSDGTILTTKNSNVSTVFARMPEHAVQSFRAIRDVAELKTRHDNKARELTIRGVVYRDNQRFFQDFQDYHRRFCEYQQSKGLLKLDAKVQRYRATRWTGLRGIRNFLNPLADNFTVPRFAAGLLLGSAVPVLVTLRSGVLAEWLVQRTHWETAPINLGLLVLAYTAAGTAVGSLFRQKSFIWALLLGYLPSRLLGSHSPLIVLPCLWMAVCADIVSKWRVQRERLV